jgi:hypothetical protein
MSRKISVFALPCAPVLGKLEWFHHSHCAGFPLATTIAHRMETNKARQEMTLPSMLTKQGDTEQEA